MKAKLITVTGFFGAPVLETAGKLAEEQNLPLIILDDEIAKADGRSIKRLVMMNGEHAYRNKEFETLRELEKSSPENSGRSLVVACGDGVLHDDDSREIIKRGSLVIVGEDMTADCLWENAKKIKDSYHAFMSFGTDDEKRQAFDKLLQRQKSLFEEVKNDSNQK